MGKQKVVAIIRLVILINMFIVEGLYHIIFDNYFIDNFVFVDKKMRKPKPDKEKFDKFMKRVTK